MRTQRLISAALLWILIALGLASCGDDQPDEEEASLLPDPPEAVAVIVGGHANMPALADPDEAAALRDGHDTAPTVMELIDGEPGKIIDETMVAEGRVIAIAGGGTPAKVYDETYHTEARNPGGFTVEHAEESRELARALVTTRATGRKVLIIVDSLLSTVEPLNNAAGLLNADTPKVITYLRDTAQIPDLTDIEVWAVGVAATADPQPQLSLQDNAKVEHMWTALFNAAHAASVTIVGAATHTDAPPGELPPVTVISNEIPCEEPPTNTITFSFTADELGFKPDEPVLLNENAAAARLTDTIAFVRANPTAKIHLIGTTSSWGTETGRLNLSKARAETIKALLLRAGIPGERITTEGVGTHFETFRPDRDAAGNLIEDIARLNRRVLVEVTQTQASDEWQGGRCARSD
jgi:outer membrane protein OmpA-like peptidoglycan-associated protein